MTQRSLAKRVTYNLTRVLMQMAAVALILKIGTIGAIGAISSTMIRQK